MVSGSAHAANQDLFTEEIRRAVGRAKARNKRVLVGATSRNGWDVERVADQDGTIFTRPVPGVPLAGVQIRLGDPEEVLTHIIQRFHYEIDELRTGDVIGWHAPHRVRRNRPESNLASGTAVRIRPASYPVGVRGGLFPQQVAVVRDILAELEGVARWGGDDRTPDESLFSLAAGPGDPSLTAVADRIRAWRATPGRGAGTVVDIYAPERLRAARALESRQRRSGG
ncbi:conserved hypothetical protein [Streptomyces clavuligerus]|nr:conserved hypothetical protein [Streptomyces clavuligerus]